MTTNAVASGIGSEIQGCKFGHGFASAANSGTVGQGTINSGGTAEMRFVLTVLVGGTVSEVTGGKFANGAVTAAMSFAAQSTLKSRVTGSGGHDYDLDAVPSSDVLGSPQMDVEAKNSLSTVASHSNKESGIAVMQDNTTSAPLSCQNEGCTFSVDMTKVKFVAHRHVESDFYDKKFAKIITELREMPGPGDHYFPVNAKVPNYFETPSGAFRVLEYKDNSWHVRTISGDPISTTWNPRDSQPDLRRMR